MIKLVLGLFNCFTCGEAMSLDRVLEKILGESYNATEIENLFNLSAIISRNYFNKSETTELFKIPEKITVKEKDLRPLRKYHSYLASRGISEETAQIYDIGYDEYNKYITFPLRNIYRECLGIGRRSIEKKIYRYPHGLQKPLYGIYELPSLVFALWIVERSF